jgi:rubrerythrin
VTELIERKELLKTFEHLSEEAKTVRDKLYLDGVMAVIDNAPTIDAAPVVHGEWRGYVCSICGGTSECGSEPFCPNCGAKMDGAK